MSEDVFCGFTDIFETDRYIVLPCKNLEYIVMDKQQSTCKRYSYDVGEASRCHTSAQHRCLGLRLPGRHAHPHAPVGTQGRGNDRYCHGCCQWAGHLQSTYGKCRDSVLPYQITRIQASTCRQKKSHGISGKGRCHGCYMMVCIKRMSEPRRVPRELRSYRPRRGYRLPTSYRHASGGHRLRGATIRICSAHRPR